MAYRGEFLCSAMDTCQLKRLRIHFRAGASKSIFWEAALSGTRMLKLAVDLDSRY
ncbi:hypothetical protein EV356DRAFT_508263 [Viridothelium virens]|uniref:Uncharacterized protein n=1 Tax=Viridothelium virens TaxID=1048519 RepID=A0A6A6GY62_VIRVR|nr:hypothetical protein EV356DRAFT_508263 [Viridothelium virens]